MKLNIKQICQYLRKGEISYTNPLVHDHGSRNTPLIICSFYYGTIRWNSTFVLRSSKMSLILSNINFCSIMFMRPAFFCWKSQLDFNMIPKIWLSLLGGKVKIIKYKTNSILDLFRNDSPPLFFSYFAWSHRFFPIIMLYLYSICIPDKIKSVWDIKQLTIHRK